MPTTMTVLDPIEKKQRETAVTAALASGVGSVYQPIVDMYRGSVVGFEALSRCTVPVGSNVGELFAQAESVGRSGELEAAAIRSALRARSAVPGDCFLSVNVGSAALAHEQVLDVLDAHSSLEGVVLEIVGSGSAESIEGAAEGLRVCRTKGASIAVAQSTFDLAGMEKLFAIEPTFVKLGVDVVGGLATNNIKLAVVDSLRHLAEAMGVGVIAQGIEDFADMESLRRLGIGFGQGYLFAAPAVGLQLETHVTQIMAAGAERSDEPTVARFIEAVDELTEDDFDSPVMPENRGIGFEVLVTDLREPVALLRRQGASVENVPLSLISENAGVSDVIRAALARPQRSRFDPFVCVDDFGGCLGVIRVERMLTALVANPAIGAAARTPAPSREPRIHRGVAPHGFRCAPYRR